MHTKPWVRARASKDYWEKMKPAGEKESRYALILSMLFQPRSIIDFIPTLGGRPFCPAMSKPDNWGVTAGDKMLEQKI